MLLEVKGTQYLTALREGGSLPGIVEADNGGTYVVKFRGAGQGSAALVAEIVVGELARCLGVRVPELVVLDVDPELARREPDQEVQHLLFASTGPNLGMDFLQGSVGYDGIKWRAPAEEAARIYWLDALTANVDRTWSNPNLLIWRRKLWAIDHGAALIFQHSWPAVDGWVNRDYGLGSHVLSEPVAGLGVRALKELDAELVALVTAARLEEVLALVPDDFLLTMNSANGADAATLRGRYCEYLLARCAGERDWWPEAAA
ncbi:HipA family kinase [Streptomyces sp. AC495_CC817]|uniref:HipA family kinase n=1 Tax=Streptomyces sp. AC495_CC817 TaxID=2823900 RepID=UPI001C27D4EC|nr:HipA family kinase [Streptomyces sp. AC495_CC817]